MNKPPEKIRVVVSKNGKAILDDCDQWSIAKWGRNRPEEAPFTEHFYTLEKPMTQKTENLFQYGLPNVTGIIIDDRKTENLTTEEAWAAMSRGECVKTAREVFHLFSGRVLKYWNGNFWVNTSVLIEGPYSIVPDPSKPKEVDGEYEKDREYVIKDNGYHEDFIEFIEKYYVRKP